MFVVLYVYDHRPFWNPTHTISMPGGCVRSVPNRIVLSQRSKLEIVNKYHPIVQVDIHLSSAVPTNNKMD
jgi:hypothetical protein